MIKKERNNEIMKQNKVLDLFFGVVITVCLTLLIGCATNKSEDYSFDDNRIETGFSVETKSGEILPWLATATKTYEKQSKKQRSTYVLAIREALQIERIRGHLILIQMMACLY